MNTERLTAIDIGNTNIDVGLFDKGILLQKKFFPSILESIEPLCQLIKEQPDRGNVIIASVVPFLSELLASRLQPKPIFVDDFKTHLLPLRVDTPNSVGVDRVVNCYGAIHLFGCPAIVISLGTATTFEAVSAAGEYLGGAILPGVNISLEALSQKAALLPLVNLKKPEKIIGTNTLEHIESGIFYGTISMMEGMVKRIKLSLGESVRVIGTGGISNVFNEDGVFDYHEPDLTLKGLQLIFRNVER